MPALDELGVIDHYSLTEYGGNKVERNELRIEVAQRIMGWQAASRSWAYQDVATVWHDEQGTPLIPTHAWRPDADDAQAMQVLARMLQLGFSYVVNGTEGHCRVSFRYGDIDKGIAEHSELRPALLTAAVAAMTVMGDNQDHPAT